LLFLVAVHPATVAWQWIEQLVLSDASCTGQSWDVGEDGPE
jgi:hypothetical protein